MRELPRQLGPYRLERRLGAGGMAEVFLAQSFGASGFEKRVVLKVLRPEHVGDAVYERMFIEEGRLGARLSHRNLVGVHDLGYAEGTDYVRLDWVDGADLATLLARAGLARRWRCSWRTRLHELLTGRRPFDGETPLETMDRVREARLGPLEEVEADVRPLLRACLALKPEERVGSAEAFRALLGPPRRARPEAGPFELARWVRGSEAAPGQAPRPAETVLEEGE